ncbi:SCO1664 family protein [Streptomyces sp. NBC_01268]|uniref:SCO1664 family protein n=1 Tax=Streptomyces sp. NBC_01268 TaxID=2903806 RepID=UPI003FCEA9A7
MPAPERIPARRMSGDRTPDVVDLLSRGELTVRGQVREASNAVLFCSVAYEGEQRDCVYKPVMGERPLWDFPDGNLARREVAAYELSEATGWGLVPPTVLREGPYGEGMVQLWVEADPSAALLALVDDEEAGEGWKAVGPAQVAEDRTALLVHADTPQLRRMAVLDAVINNGDRKGGHLLPVPDGRLYGIDHGVSFHVDDKLRTLLWGWAGEELTEEAAAVLDRLDGRIAPGTPLAERLAGLLTGAEVDALRERVALLRRTGRHPVPSGQWPAIPWPPV